VHFDLPLTTLLSIKMNFLLIFYSGCSLCFIKFGNEKNNEFSHSDGLIAVLTSYSVWY